MIRESLGKYERFDQSYAYALAEADAALESGIDVPVPKDAAGGYTHEQHKKNYYAMYYAGIVYQVSGEQKYADFVCQMLHEYAQLYPTLGQHPYVGSPVPGRLFWQTLNESVWLVHTAMAYDCVYDYMSAKERAFVEKNLFLPIARFIEQGTPANYKTFNRMHNHATWANAAVGMIGYVMGNQDLIDRALYGSEKDGKGGFLLQLEKLFSPDGYFTEGAYYLRYAIWPFMLFGQAIELCQPELAIFERRDGILLKAMNGLIEQSYDGTILRMNDALEKTFSTQEIVCALNIAYYVSRSPELLDIAAQQTTYTLSAAGISTAIAVAEGKSKPFEYHSMLLCDGEYGDKGGVALMRSRTDKNMLLTLKATSHGLSHGHYDKLTVAMYDNHHEILTDYGAARFLNIESKSGGRYTHENDTYAMQTVAHNTLVADETSHFHADYNTSMRYASRINFAQFTDSIQIVSATDNNAYLPERIGIDRTIALVENPNLDFPITIDIMRAHASEPHTYDLPFHYNGQLIWSSFPCKRESQMLVPMGTQFGYEHLWLEQKNEDVNGLVQFTWLLDDRFYSVSSLLNHGEVYLTRSGANDPDMNLRNEPAVILRQPAQESYTFVSVLEPHGVYDLNLELTKNAYSQVQQIELLYDDEQYTAVRFQFRQQVSPMLLIIAYQNQSNTQKHSLNIGGNTYRWTGNYHLIY
ncbi:MAG: heparinase II/III family protein [Paludibacteraceae bacterium]